VSQNRAAVHSMTALLGSRTSLPLESPLPRLADRMGWCIVTLQGLLTILVCAGQFVLCGIPVASASPVAALFMDQQAFRDAVESERIIPPLDLQITGISVPHHLLAADLIARGFWAASGNQYDRVIILSPDHFNKSKTLFATTLNNFDTAFGVLENDRAAVGLLLQSPELFGDADLFGEEHGIGALVPFVKHFFESAKVIPIAISYRSRQADWDRAFNILKTLIGPRVLVVQSTDYSHYLPMEIAVLRDQETLNVVAANDLGAVAGLVQPIHMDSKGAQYIQMRLQSETLNSQGIVIGNRNSAMYRGSSSSTTSYVVSVYSQNPAIASRLKYQDQKVIYFGGDTFFGRLIREPLSNPYIAKSTAYWIRDITGGAPLVLNLETVLLKDPPEKIPNDTLVSYADLAIPFLKDLNVKAVSLANNHSFDVGGTGYIETISILKASGIIPLINEDVVDLGAVRIVALNRIPPKHSGSSLFTADPTTLCSKLARPPLIAFMHWGREFSSAASSDEYLVASTLRSCGVSAIIGAHSHVASTSIEALQGGEYQMTFSLGNLLFDQRTGRSSGVLMEMRIFELGTYSARLIPIPNFYERGMRILHAIRSLDKSKPLLSDGKYEPVAPSQWANPNK
jgi:AmmeMemoRadiSam system protein B